MKWGGEVAGWRREGGGRGQEGRGRRGGEGYGQGEGNLGKGERNVDGEGRTGEEGPDGRDEGEGEACNEGEERGGCVDWWRGRCVLTRLPRRAPAADTRPWPPVSRARGQSGAAWRGAAGGGGGLVLRHGGARPTTTRRRGHGAWRGEARLHATRGGGSAASDGAARVATEAAHACIVARGSQAQPLHVEGSERAREAPAPAAAQRVRCA